MDIRILIADDSEADQKTLAALLSEQGDITRVSSGAAVFEALKKAQDEGDPFHLLCLDILMPDMDGLDVLQKLRKSEKERHVPRADRLRVMITTGLGDVKHVLKATNLGCDGYITKPIDKERLMIELSKLELPLKWS